MGLSAGHSAYGGRVRRKTRGLNSQSGVGASGSTVSTRLIEVETREGCEVYGECKEDPTNHPSTHVAEVLGHGPDGAPHLTREGRGVHLGIRLGVWTLTLE